MNKKKVLVVAEISANHGQNFNRAIKLIREAKKSGAGAVKFQTYMPDTITLDVDKKDFRVHHEKWGGQTLYSLYKKAYTPWHWFKKLKQVADDEGLVFFSTAFDKTAVDFLEDLGVPFHKVASFELVDIPLIEYMAKTGKPLIISTGMATLPEVKEAVSAARKAGAGAITLLKCVSGYPAEPEDMNLMTLPDIQRRFRTCVGISDHTLGIAVSVASVALGAVMIEKHLTLSRKIQTEDSFFSIEPLELKALVENVQVIEKALGEVFYGVTKQEKNSIIYRRSLFAAKDIIKGESFTDDNIKSYRPAIGMKPKYLKLILGKNARTNIKRGTPMDWKFVSLAKNKTRS
jgi:pseudaminic acid synthase